MSVGVVGGQVVAVLSPAQAFALSGYARVGQRALQQRASRDGADVPSEHVELVSALAAASAVSAAGHPLSVGMSVNGRELADGVGGGGRFAGDGINVETAAEWLGLTPRQVRRLAPSLGGRLVGGRWLLDTHAVDDYRRHRAG